MKYSTLFIFSMFLLSECTTGLEVEPITQEQFYLNGLITNKHAEFEFGSLDNGNKSNFKVLCQEGAMIKLINQANSEFQVLLPNDTCRFALDYEKSSATYKVDYQTKALQLSTTTVEVPGAQTPDSIMVKSEKNIGVNNSFSLNLEIKHDRTIPKGTYAAIEISSSDSSFYVYPGFSINSRPFIFFLDNASLVEEDLYDIPDIKLRAVINVLNDKKRMEAKVTIYYVNEDSYYNAKKIYDQYFSLFDPFAVPVIVNGNVEGAFGFVYGAYEYEKIIEIDLP